MLLKLAVRAAARVVRELQERSVRAVADMAVGRAPGALDMLAACVVVRMMRTVDDES